MTDKEQIMKDCISIVRAFFSEEMRRCNRLPEEEAKWKGNFITITESDLVNQLKNILK